MKKRPRRTSKPNRPARPSSEAPWPAGDPRWGLVKVVAGVIAKRAEQIGSGHPEPDADLLKFCAIVNQVNTQPNRIDSDEWQRALLRVSTLEALTLSGLKAKLEIALTVVGIRPEPGDEYDNVDRMLLWLTLTEVLAIIDAVQA